jgi:DNA repair protein RadD
MSYNVLGNYSGEHRLSTVLRDYQENLIDRIYAANHARTIAVLPTGGGKTATAAAVAGRFPGRSVMIAHRRELVVQISLAFARAEIPHRIIGPDVTRAACIERQIHRIGASWIHDGANAAVASIDAMLVRPDPWLSGVELWQIDEGHHVQPGNKWHRGIAMLTRAHRGVAWSATPMRSDGGPMASVYDGLVEGPNTATLVGRGFITPIDAYSLPPAFARSAVRVSQKTGDFSGHSLREVTAKARVYGSVVAHYLRLARGLRGVTFCVDRELAELQAVAYRAAGVPAAALVDGIGDRARFEILDKFERGELLQITSVDIIGEGLDIPDIGVVSLARATESSPLHWQQIGRVRRPSSGKRAGIVIDHVGNLIRHGVTDGIDAWSLTTGPIRLAAGGAGIPVRQCGRDGCWRVYESFRLECPYCGWEPPAVQASRPADVEGDLLLYTPELMAELAARAAVVIRPANRSGPPGTPAEAAIRKNTDARAAAQTRLRQVMNDWAVRVNMPESEAYRRFFRTFGIDAATALTLGTKEATQLTERIENDETEIPF